MGSLQTLAFLPSPSPNSPILSAAPVPNHILFFAFSLRCHSPHHRRRRRCCSSSPHLRPPVLPDPPPALPPSPFAKHHRRDRRRRMLVLPSSLHVDGAPLPPSTRILGNDPVDDDAHEGPGNAASGASASAQGNAPFPVVSPILLADSVASAVDSAERRRRAERVERRSAERSAYLFAAVASTAGITFLTIGAIYYRFAWQTQGVEVPFSEMFGTFSLAFGASVGMEYWARWAHRALWHESLWSMHESHHGPRDGPFELNDVFAIINAVPAIALIAYGFFHKGFVPGLCFGAGLGITMFGIAYMFVHDGLVHRRFPVGPIADVPYFQKVAAAHQLHHADKFNGVPYGLFLGPKELEAEEGGAEELERTLQMRKAATPRA